MPDITQIEQLSPDDAESLCRTITYDLPEYFGLPECNESYAKGVREYINFAIKHEGTFVGLISLKFPYPQSGQIYWTGILRRYQGHGFGPIFNPSSYSLCQTKQCKYLDG